jgi:hypothetical protein
MKYENVFCFSCKKQCVTIPEKLSGMSQGEPVQGCQCPKCRTLFVAGEGQIDGRMVAMLEAQLEAEQ